MELENSEMLMAKDGTFKTLDYIKDMLPYGDEIMYLTIFKSINEGLLTEDEISNIDRDIFRLQQSYKTKLNKSIEHQDKIAEERKNI